MVDFFGQQSTLDGQPLPAGAVARAYDPTGVLAGQSEVSLAGWYLVSVYGDDPQTAGLDAEGVHILHPALSCVGQAFRL